MNKLQLIPVGHRFELPRFSYKQIFFSKQLALHILRFCTCSFCPTTDDRNIFKSQLEIMYAECQPMLYVDFQLTERWQSFD